MGGGAFDYLCYEVEYSCVEHNIETLQQMIQFVTEEKENIEDSQSIINHLQRKICILQTLWTKGDIELLHDIEWAASGDYSYNQIETMEYYQSKG